METFRREAAPRESLDWLAGVARAALLQAGELGETA